MSLHQNKKELLTTGEQSHYLPILGSLLIGFIIAWTIRQPGFQTKTYDSHGAAPLARDLPLRTVEIEEIQEQAAHTFGEFQPLEEETPPVPQTVERNNALPTPELFTKTTPTDGGYLLSFSTNNFIVGKDGYLVLTQGDKEVTKIYASPYYINDEDGALGTATIIQLVNTEGKYILNNGKPISDSLVLTNE